MTRAALILGGPGVILGAAAAAEVAAVSSRGAQATAMSPQPICVTGCVKVWDPSTMGPPPPGAQVEAPAPPVSLDVTAIEVVAKTCSAT